MGKHLGSILLRRACISGQTSLIFLFYINKSTTYKRLKKKSPNIPKYIQGEIENDMYSHIWHIPCTFSMDKLGMELRWNTGMKYRIVEIKQEKGECFCIWDFWSFQRKVLDWSGAQRLWFSFALRAHLAGLLTLCLPVHYTCLVCDTHLTIPIWAIDLLY